MCPWSPSPTQVPIPSAGSVKCGINLGSKVAKKSYIRVYFLSTHIIDIKNRTPIIPKYTGI